MKKRLAALLTALILLAGIGSASAESKTEEKPAEVILYCVQIPESKDGAVGVFCIDKAGILWGTAESDLKPDCGEEDVLQMIRERRGMQKMENLFLLMYDGTVMTESWFSDLAAMADDVPTAEGTPTQTGMYDSHTAIYAVRHLVVDGKDIGGCYFVRELRDVFWLERSTLKDRDMRHSSSVGDDGREI